MLDFLNPCGQSVTVHGCIGLLVEQSCVNVCFDVYESGNGRETRVH